MRLAIGVGKFAKDGWTNIDVEKRKGVDIVADFRTLHFENVDEIDTRHLLEHFSREESIEVLRQWHSWLKPDGRIFIETPDFERICKMFHEGDPWANEEWMARHAYGSQEADWAFHKDGWYKAKFEKILPEIGFKIVEIDQRYSHSRCGTDRLYRLPNIAVIAEKI